MVVRSILAILWLGWALARLHAVALPDERPKRGTIDSETIAAYEKLGAVYGGFYLSAEGRFEF
jgi:hypothetical protein